MIKRQAKPDMGLKRPSKRELTYTSSCQGQEISIMIFVEVKRQCTETTVTCSSTIKFRLVTMYSLHLYLLQYRSAVAKSIQFVVSLQYNLEGFNANVDFLALWQLLGNIPRWRGNTTWKLILHNVVPLQCNKFVLKLNVI